MKYLRFLTLFSLDHPRTVLVLIGLVTAVFLWQFPSMTIDTDPENMLEVDQPDRVFYDGFKEEFGIHDLVVVGLVLDEGVFRPQVLEKVQRSIQKFLEIDGVIIEDVTSLTTTDNIRAAGGVLTIEPSLTRAPADAVAMEGLRQAIATNPLLHEKIVSGDGEALAIYLPIDSKDASRRIADRAREILLEEGFPSDAIHVAGLPVAEDTFGHEMFLQMAVVAPAAFAVILLLVYLLFRRLVFLLPVSLDAMLAVMWAMGLLIWTGHSVHIMSSMIPVFLMPIAILDDVHVLSEFFDRYRELRDKREALLQAMEPLYRPMLFTSITSAVGFASLGLADIPPVRVFGVFVAFGILAAWLFSMTVVPVMISLTPDRHLARQGAKRTDPGSPWFDGVLAPLGRLAFGRPVPILVGGVLLLALGVVGLSRIQVNDNPVRWFRRAHPVRVADRVLNESFAGTYMTYLVASGPAPESLKDPVALQYLDALQSELETSPLVGTTSSVADLVKRINFVLHDEDPRYDVVATTAGAVGQLLFLFQSSGDPNDLDNFLNFDGSSAAIWVQMKSGDNRHMKEVEEAFASFQAQRPPPSDIRFHWTGLTYINQIWQDLMVRGMARAVAGSFVVVFVLMVLTQRSLLFGSLSMIPLTFAIVLSYGLVGWIGQDYNMPIAVCAALSLGLAIDFAIHFLERFKEHLAAGHSWDEATRYMFREPGRAIARNAVVVSLGFLPLTASTLTPYVIVGIFFALLMFLSAVATLLILPATLGVLPSSRLLHQGEAGDLEPQATP